MVVATPGGWAVDWSGAGVAPGAEVLEEFGDIELLFGVVR